MREGRKKEQVSKYGKSMMLQIESKISDVAKSPNKNNKNQVRKLDSIIRQI